MAWTETKGGSMDSNDLDKWISAKEEIKRRFLLPGIRAGVVGMARTSSQKAAARAGLHVHGVGVGLKIKEGVTTETMALRVYVIQKVTNKDGLQNEETIPPFVNGIPTDVIEANPALLFAETPRQIDVARDILPVHDSVIGGLSTSREGGAPGTIACFCHPVGGEDPLVLSNYHIYGPTGGGSDFLVQPSSNDDQNEFATFIPGPQINFDGVSPNTVDAAVGRLMEGIHFSQEVQTIGRITGTARAYASMDVRKYGSGTGLRNGTVDTILFDLACGATALAPAIGALFTNQFRIKKNPGQDKFANDGDSGALIVAQHSQDAVGLLFAKDQNGDYGVANHLQEVLDILNIDLT
jgi:hypothetical protein